RRSLRLRLENAESTGFKGAFLLDRRELKPFGRTNPRQIYPAALTPQPAEDSLGGQFPTEGPVHSNIRDAGKFRKKPLFKNRRGRSSRLLIEKRPFFRQGAPQAFFGWTFHLRDPDTFLLTYCDRNRGGNGFGQEPKPRENGTRSCFKLYSITLRDFPKK